MGIAALCLALLCPAPTLAAAPAPGLEGATEFFGEGSAIWKAGPPTLASLKVQTLSALVDFIRKNHFYGFALEDVRHSLAALGCEGEQVLTSRVEGVGVVWCLQSKTNRPVVAFNFVETGMRLAIATGPPRPLLFDNASLRYRNGIGNWLTAGYDSLTFSLFYTSRVFDSRLGKLVLVDLQKQDLPQAVRQNTLAGFGLRSEGGALLVQGSGAAFDGGFVVAGDRRVYFQVTPTGIAFSQNDLKALKAGDTLLTLQPGGVWGGVSVQAPLGPDGQLPVKPFFARLSDQQGNAVSGTLSALTLVAGTDPSWLEVDWSPTAKGFTAGGAVPTARGDKSSMAGSAVPVARGDWTREESGTKATLTNVWGASGRDLYAIGAGGLVLHYDGSRWNEFKRRTRAVLLGLWGASPSAVFAVGEEGVILRCDNRECKEQDSGVKTALRAVWGSDASNVYAVGDQGVILHYDGRRWTPQPSPSRSALSAIWGSSGSEAWASGAGGHLLQLRKGAWVEIGWRPSDEHSALEIHSIWGVSATEFYLVGAEEFSRFQGAGGNAVLRLFHPTIRQVTIQGDRVRVRELSFKGMQIGEQTYWDVWGDSGSGIFFASPLGVRHYAPQPAVSTLLGERKNEPALVWKGEEITAVWGTPEGDVVAVGQKGTILRQRPASQP